MGFHGGSSFGLIWVFGGFGFLVVVGLFGFSVADFVVVCIELGKKESWGKKKKTDGEERENGNGKKLIFK